MITNRGPERMEQENEFNRNQWLSEAVVLTPTIQVIRCFVEMIFLSAVVPLKSTY
jgi:hypothetical protein